MANYERVGKPMKAEDLMALRNAAIVLRRYGFPGARDVLDTIVADEERKRRRMLLAAPKRAL